MTMATDRFRSPLNARPLAAAVLGAAMLLLPAEMAGAADIITDQSPEPPVTAVGDTYLWTGPYLGVYGGYKWLHSDASGASDISGIDGLTGGAYLGYNYQLGGNWVTGLEGMVGISGADHSFGGISVDQDWEASLRARMGYAFENSMIYGLAGVGGTDVNASTTTGSDSNVLLGWQIGAGIETVLTEGITGRVEYDYSDYAARGFSLGAAGSPDIGLAGHTVKVGVGFKF